MIINNIISIKTLLITMENCHYSKLCDQDLLSHTPINLIGKIFFESGVFISDIFLLLYTVFLSLWAYLFFKT